MGLLDWITSKRRQPATGNMSQVYVDSTIRTGERQVYSAQNPDAALAVSQCFGMVQVAVQRVARDVAAVPLRLYRPAGEQGGKGSRVDRAVKRYLASGAAGSKAATFRADDELEMVTEHPILDWLSRPNAYMSGVEFRQIQAAFKLLTGSAYVLADADKFAMHPLYPQYTRVIGGTDGVVGGFVYGRSENDVVLAPDQVWWSRYMPSPFSPLEGLSPLRAVFTEQQVYAAASQMELALFDNSGRPDYIASVEGNAGPELIEAIKNKFEARHRGAAKTGRGAFIGNGKVTVQPIGWAPKDLGNIETQRHMVTLILAALGVPESEVFLNDANLASSVTGNKQYLRQTVMPMAVHDGEDLTRWVVEGVFGLDGWCLAPENMVGTDYAQETLVLQSQLASGVVSINEARLALGFEEVEDEQADVLRINGTPLGQQPQALSPFGLSGEADGAKSADSVRGDVQPERDDDGGAVQAAPAAPEREPDPEPVVVREAPTGDAGPGCVGCDCGSCKAQLTSARKAWLDDAAAWAKTVDPIGDNAEEEADTPTIRLYRKVRKALEERRDAILRASEEKPFGLDQRAFGMRQKADASEELIRRLLSAWGITDQAARFADETEAATRAEAQALFDAGVETGLGQVAEITELPTLDNSRSVAFFENFQSTYIRGLAEVDKTTATRVEAALRDAMAGGENLRGVQARIREVFDGETPDGQRASDARAAMVARSESARAVTQGRFGGYAAAGVTKYAFKLAPNACEFCEAVAREYEGKVVTIGEPLYKQGSVLQGVDGGTMNLDFDDTIVPIHPNCGCATTPVVE
jgi:HK97 family phage portal protein